MTSRTDEQIIEETNELARFIMAELIGTGFVPVNPDAKLYEMKDPRAVKAWEAAVKIMEMTTKTEMADVVASLDEPEAVVRKYGIRLWATFRGECDITVEATSFEAAIEAARKLDHNDHNFTFTDTVEGDQSAQVFGPDDDNPDDDDEWGGDGVEVDMRADGDPFSWTACHITKELAALFDKPQDPECLSIVTNLISEAHRACNKITGGQEG